MEPTVFTDTEGEIYDAGALRLRLLAQSPDQPIAVTDNVVPPGVVHTFANPGSSPVRFLEILQPAGNEQFFKEAVQRMAAGPWSPAEMAEMAARYDFEPVIEPG